MNKLRFSLRIKNKFISIYKETTGYPVWDKRKGIFKFIGWSISLHPLEIINKINWPFYVKYHEKDILILTEKENEN